MRRLAGHLLVTIILVCLLLAASTVLWRKYNPSPYQDMPEQITLANTGSSHGVHDFDWTVTSQTDAFSFANDSQSLYYDFQLVKHYIERFRSGAVLLIPVSYFSLYQSQYEPMDSFTRRNELYYSLLDMDEIARVDQERFLMKRYLPALLVIPDKMQMIFQENAREESAKNPQRDQYSIQEIGALRSRYHYEGLKRIDGEIVRDEESWESLTGLIRLCKEQKIRPVLVTTPYLKYYNDGWPEDFFSLFYEDVEAAAAEYAIEYWDYSHDPVFQTREEYFIDTDHLSPEGAAVFQKMILERLER